MNKGNTKKSNRQFVWGIALVLMGVAVFVRISQVMPELEQMGQFGGFSRFGLYLLGVILVGGGIKKIVTYFKAPGVGPTEDHGDKEGQ